MLGGLKVIGDQLTKGLDKAPGWVPLFGVTLVWMEWSHMDLRLRLGREFTIPPELYALFLTFVLYKIGDALDEFVYKQPTPDGTDRTTRDEHKAQYAIEQRRAQSALRASSGSYAAAMKLVGAAEDEGAKSVHVLNETAKFLRSLIVPALIAFVVLHVMGHPCLGVVILLVAPVALWLYLECKVGHIRRLYRLVPPLVSAPYYSARDLDRIRLHFWNGTLVTSTNINYISSKGAIYRLTYPPDLLSTSTALALLANLDELGGTDEPTLQQWLHANHALDVTRLKKMVVLRPTGDLNRIGVILLTNPSDQKLAEAITLDASRAEDFD